MPRLTLRTMMIGGSLALLALWLMPSLAPLVLALTLVLWAFLGVTLAHEYGFTAPLRSKWSLPMDLLDQFTNRTQLEGLVSARQKSELIDAPALAATVKQKVVGQDAVADEVALTIRRRLAMEQREKPVGVFCFAGPAGVGKTEMGKQFADALDRGFLLFDMSTCNTREGASTLFGSPKGYAGSDSYGQLTAGLKAQPSSVVLLDEIEKASPDVMRRFLTAWNDGFVTEASDGKKIRTSSAIFIMTTNANADRIGELAGEIGNRDQLNAASKEALREAGFPPEVLSRIDRVFSFRHLEGLDVARVAVVHLLNLVRGYGLDVAENGIDADLLFDAMQRSELLQQAGGVREIIRALEDQVADGLIDAKSGGADTVRLVVQGTETDASGKERIVVGVERAD